MVTLEHIPIETLNLSRKMLNAIRRNGIRTFGDLREAEQAGKLLELRFIGVKRAHELKELITRILAEPHKFIETANTSETNQTSEIYTKSLKQISTTGQFSNIPIKSLNLSRQITNALIKNGIVSVEELLNVDESTLLQINHLGPKSIKAIQEELTKVLDSPATYIESKPIEKEKLMTWAEMMEPFLISERPARIYTLISRFGLNIKTLEEIANDLGLTRERVRQLQEVVAKRFTRHINTMHLSSLWVLEKAIGILTKQQEQLSLALFQSSLIEEGVLGEFSEPIRCELYESLNPLEILICWPEILRNEKFTRLPETYPIEINDLRKAKNISIYAYKLLRGIPRKRIRKLLRKVAFTGGVNLKDAMKILSVPEEIAILEIKRLNLEEIRDEWYSSTALGNQNNRFPIRFAGLKMLATVDQVSLEDFLEGLRRHTARFYESLAPPDVVQHYIELLGFEVKDQRVRTSLPTASVLSKSEQYFMDAVKRNNGVVNFLEIAEEFFSQKLSLAAVSVVLKRSPIVEKIDVGLYKARGTEVSWLDIENARNRQKKLSHDVKIAYGLDGIIRYKITINSWAYLTGVVSIYQLKGLSGNWSLLYSNGHHETISMDELLIQGLGKSLKELEVKVGDRIEISFNTWDRTITLRKVKHE